MDRHNEAIICTFSIITLLHIVPSSQLSMKYVIWTITKPVYLTHLGFTFSPFFKRLVLANC